MLMTNEAMAVNEITDRKHKSRKEMGSKNRTSGEIDIYKTGGRGIMMTEGTVKVAGEPQRYEN